MAPSSSWLDPERLERALSIAGIRRGAGRPNGETGMAVATLRRLSQHRTRSADSTRRPPSSVGAPPSLHGALKNRLSDFVDWLTGVSKASSAYVLDSDGIAMVSRHGARDADERVLPVATALLDTLRLMKGPLREEGVKHAAVALPGCGMVAVVSSMTNLGPYYAAWATRENLDPAIAERVSAALQVAINGRQGER